MEEEQIEYENDDRKKIHPSSRKSESVIEHDLRGSHSKKEDFHVRRAMHTRDVSKHDRKRKVKRVMEQQHDPEDEDVGHLESERVNINKNGGLISLKYYQEMEERFSLSLKEKDHHISSFMKDLKVAEDENAKYKTKLLELKEKFKVATNEIVLAEEAHTLLSEKYKKLQEQHEALKLRDRLSNKQENALMEKIKNLENALAHPSHKPENELEDFLETIKAKEKEIEELKCKLQNAGYGTSQLDLSEVLIFQKHLLEKNGKIKDLESKLKEAVLELEECTKALEIMKSERLNNTNDVTVTGISYNDENLSKTEEKQLKRQLETLSYKLAVATEKLRRFEKNQYGLPEALAEVEDLKRQIHVRDLNIAELVLKINEYSTYSSDYTRKRRQSTEAEVHKPKRRSKNKMHDKKIFEKMLVKKTFCKAKFPVYFTQEEMINKVIKWGKIIRIFCHSSNMLQRKKLSETLLESQAGTCQKYNSESLREENLKQVSIEEISAECSVQEEGKSNQVIMKNRILELIAENDCLRKGMHEILDSIRTQDGEYYASIKKIHLLVLHFASSDVKLESKSLEELLHALDQRHVSGWYHPAMRLETQLKSFEGVNSALREQIRSTRQEEKITKAKLQTALSQLDSLKTELIKSDIGDIPASIKSILSETLIFSKHIDNLLKDLVDDNLDNNKNEIIKQNLTKMYAKFIVLHQQLSTLYQEKIDEKQNWIKEKEELICCLNETRASLEASKLNAKSLPIEIKPKDENYPNEDKLICSSVESSQKVIDNQPTKKETGEEALKRRYNTLEIFTNNLKKENEQLQMDMQFLKLTLIQKEEDNERENEIIKQQIITLKNKVDEYVPRCTVEETTKKLNELIIKYRALLQEENLSILKEQILKQTQEELQSFKHKNDNLQKELVGALKKLRYYETTPSGDQIKHSIVEEEEVEDKVLALSEKIAILEVGEISAKKNNECYENMCDSLKSQLVQLNAAYSEMETVCLSLKQQNHELQLAEMNLQDQLNNLICSNDQSDVEHCIQDAGQHLHEIKEENLKIQRRAEIAEEKLQSFQYLNSLQNLETESLRQRIIDLQSESDDKAIIAKVNNELLHSQNLLAMSNDKNQLLEKQTENLCSENTRLKQSLHEKDLENLNNKKKMMKSFRQLLRCILEMRIMYGGAITLPMQEKMHRDRFLLLKECIDAKIMSFKMEDILLDSVSLPERDEFYSKNPETKGTKVKQLATLFADQAKDFENKLKKQNKYISKLENDNILLEKKYELNKLQFENREYELLKELGHFLNAELTQGENMIEGVAEESPKLKVISKLKIPHIPSREKQLYQELEVREKVIIENCSHNEEIIAQQNIIKELIEHLAKVEFELNERETDLKEMQAIIAVHVDCQLENKCKGNTGKTESQAHFLNKPLMRDFSFACKVSMDALNILLNQKNEALSRYKQLVSETRVAHAKTLHDLHWTQNLNLQEKTMGNQNISKGVLMNYQKLPEDLHQIQTPIPLGIQQYSDKIVELKNEVILQQRKCDYLAVQINIWESEAHHYKALSDKRQLEMEELYDRLEKQQKAPVERPNTGANINVRNVGFSEENVISVEPVKEEHLVGKLISGESELSKKMVIDIGTNTDFPHQSADEELSHTKKGAEKVQGLPYSKEEAEDLDQELETLNNLINKAEEGSDDKRLDKVVNEHKFISGLKLRDGIGSKPVGIASQIKIEKLKSQIKKLEEQLQNSQLELENVSKDAEVDTKRKVELTKWEESKKWQNMVNKLHEKLKSEKASKDNLNKINSSLKDAVARLQREKAILELKVKNAVSSKESQPISNTTSEKRLESLQKRISTLEKTVVDLEMLNIAYKEKLDKFWGKRKSHSEKERLELENERKEENESKELDELKDVLLEMKILKEELDILQKENTKYVTKINNLEEEITILKEQNYALKEKRIVSISKEETASMIHNEVNALRVELARKAKILQDVKGVLIRVREKTKNKKSLARNT